MARLEGRYACPSFPCHVRNKAERACLSICLSVCRRAPACLPFRAWRLALVLSRQPCKANCDSPCISAQVGVRKLTGLNRMGGAAYLAKLDKAHSFRPHARRQVATQR